VSLLAAHEVATLLLLFAAGEDASKPDNALPDDVRAKLISIGIWMLREAQSITNGKSRNFAGLIEISNLIAEGL